MSSEAVPAYHELVYEHQKGACSTKFLSNREFIWELKTGQSLAAKWPDDVTLQMNPERAKDVALIDYVHNLESLLVASPAIVAFLERQGLPQLEFLPVGILDHKGRVASSEYRIVHCCNVVDCIDQEQSEFEWDGLSTPSMVLERAVLTPAVLDGDGRLIRPKFVPGKVFYRADLVEAMDAEEFDGVTFLQDLFE